MNVRAAARGRGVSSLWATTPPQVIAVLVIVAAKFAAAYTVIVPIVCGLRLLLAAHDRVANVVRRVEFAVGTRRGEIVRYSSQPWVIARSHHRRGDV